MREHMSGPSVGVFVVSFYQKPSLGSVSILRTLYGGVDKQNLVTVVTMKSTSLHLVLCLLCVWRCFQDLTTIDYVIFRT